ncbi:MAG: UDP-3-O-(3-hydroxymyristoyl)glucosamine N-acyltransferase [Kistimonas sp.]|nr:UDP-3-O-(3-hydroxymyristoyl)glucosamine N-acyltransferase [Kistimonas sp.]
MKSLKQYTLEELASFLQAQIQGDPAVVITGLSSLQDAGPGSLSFLANPGYKKYLADTQAGAVIVRSEDVAALQGRNALIVSDPYLAFARTSHLFAVEDESSSGVHPSAIVSASAKVDAGAWIGPGVIVEAGASVARGARIFAQSFVGPRCHIGEGTVLHPRVTLRQDVTLGEDCIIHSGAVIGDDGFGLARHGSEWVKISQLGGVVIGNQVEIGSNTTIDRGALGNTCIGDGVKLDNQIQVGHNVEIGCHTAIAACVGVSGSTRIGRRCVIGGGTGIAGHLTIADDVYTAGMAMITRSIRQAGVWSSGGIGTMPVEDWRRNTVRFRQLDSMAKRLKLLEQRLEQMDRAQQNSPQDSASAERFSRDQKKPEKAAVVRAAGEVQL